MKRGDVI